MQKREILIAALALAGILTGSFVFAVTDPIFGKEIPPPIVDLQIPLGGVQRITTCTKIVDILSCSGLRDYTILLYNFLVRAAGIFSVLMLSYGGFLWLTAGGDSGKVGEAKKTIGNTLIGLSLALGSFTLLYTLNPALVDLQPLSLQKIDRKDLEIGSSLSAANLTALGFPQPDTSKDFIALPSSLLAKWRDLAPIILKVAKETGVDPGILGMWAWIESNFNQYMENCDIEHRSSGDTGDDSNPNTPCYEWGDYWQVGLGIHPAHTMYYLPEAFQKMYGSASDETVQKIGQKVLDDSHSLPGSITLIDNFPKKSVQQIIQGARTGDNADRVLLTTLIKDPAIGTYLKGRHFNDLIQDGKKPLADIMEGWGKKSYPKQRISNRIKAIYDAGF